MQSLEFFKNLIRRLEDPQTPFLNIILTFIGAISLRNYLEQFSTKVPASMSSEIHYCLFYITIALTFITFFHFVTKESINKITRVVLPCFIILLVVPVMDLLISCGKGYQITYLYPGTHHHILRSFFLYSAPFEGKGITPGQRMEVVLLVGMSFIYFFLKTNRILRSVIFASFIYVIIFFYAALPFVYKILLGCLGIPFTYFNETMTRFCLLLMLPLSQGVFYLYNKQYFIEIWKDSRPLRNIHFQMMVILGFVCAIHSSPNRFFEMQWPWIFIPPAIIFAGIFSIIINNCEDYEIDCISNRKRPTVSKSIPSGHYKILAWISFCLALINAAAVNCVCFFTILLWITNYFLYSSPPFRFKLVPFFSKLVISLNSLLLFGLGYSLQAGTIMIPKRIVLFFLVCITAVINFIDLKDYEGDKNAGIKTLATILGLEKSKLIIGLFFILTYSLTFFLFKDMFLQLVMMSFGLLIFLMINRKHYSEKPIFIIYFLSILFLIKHFWGK